MPKPALAEPTVDERKEIESADAFERRVAAENNAQFQELRDQAQATLAAVKGSRAIQGPKGWEVIFQKAKIGYESGRFLIQQLGAERYLEPELMATLVQLRRDLLVGIDRPTAADTMSADIAIIAYRNLLRVQGWIGSLCLTVERELFGQAPLNEIHGPTIGKELEQNLRRLEEHLSLLERCHRMVARSLVHLEARRGQAAKTSVTVAQAGQVNVDCAVLVHRHPVLEVAIQPVGLLEPATQRLLDSTPKADTLGLRCPGGISKRRLRWVVELRPALSHHPGGEVGAGDGTARRERLLLGCLGQRADDGAGADQPPQRRLRCGAAGPALALLVLALSVGRASYYTI